MTSAAAVVKWPAAIALMYHDTKSGSSMLPLGRAVHTQQSDKLAARETFVVKRTNKFCSHASPTFKQNLKMPTTNIVCLFAGFEVSAVQQMLIPIVV